MSPFDVWERLVRLNVLSNRSGSHTLGDKGNMKLLFIDPGSVANQNVRVTERLQDGDFLPQLLKVSLLINANLVPCNFNSAIAINSSINNFVGSSTEFVVEL